MPTKNAGAAASTTTEPDSAVSHEDTDGDGWMEVGKRNRMAVTCTVCVVWSFWCRVFRVFSFTMSIHLPFLPSFLAFLLTRLLVIYTDKRHRIPNDPYIRW